MTNPGPTGQILYIQMNVALFEAVDVKSSTCTGIQYTHLGLLLESLSETVIYSIE